MLSAKRTLLFLELAGVAPLVSTCVHQAPLLGLVEGLSAAGADVAILGGGPAFGRAGLRGHESADGAQILNTKRFHN